MDSNTSKTPFCTVCFDAGKNKDVYQGHWVRDAPGGKVVCPTLLNHKCEYCKKKGHMPSHCRNLKRSNASKAAKAAGKKFCAVCFNDGKSEDDFTSHWVKESVGGKVCCPTLLANECRYCKKKGHKISHCRKLKRRNARRTAAPPATPSPKMTLGTFAAGVQKEMVKKDTVKPLPKTSTKPKNFANNKFQALMDNDPNEDETPATGGPRPMAPPSPKGIWNKSKHVTTLPAETTAKWGDEMYDHDETGDLNTAC